MRRIIFTYAKGWNDTVKEIAEYDYDVKDEEIQRDFEEWVWSIIGDKFTWYEEK